MKHVLVVDDSASMRSMVALTLGPAGYSVTQASDGLAALTWLEENDVDLVLTDLNMPHLDGLELARRLRQLERHRFTPVIMLTTQTSPEKKQEGRAAGASAWIVKPFDPPQLLSVLQRTVR